MDNFFALLSLAGTMNKVSREIPPSTQRHNGAEEQQDDGETIKREPETITHYNQTKVHYMTKSVWTPEHLIPKSWVLICSWSPLCCYNSLHSSGKAFHKMLKHCCGDLLLFNHKSISEIGH